MKHKLLIGADFLNTVQITNTNYNNYKYWRSRYQCFEVSSGGREVRKLGQLLLESDEVNSIDMTHILNKHRNAIKSFDRPHKTRDSVRSGTELKMTILLKDNEPVYQRARRLSLIEREQVNAQVDE